MKMVGDTGTLVFDPKIKYCVFIEKFIDGVKYLDLEFLDKDMKYVNCNYETINTDIVISRDNYAFLLENGFEPYKPLTHD